MPYTRARALLLALPLVLGAAPPRTEVTWDDYQALSDEYRGLLRAADRAHRAATTDAERARASRRLERERHKLVARYMALADRRPESFVAPYALLFVAHHAPEGKALDAALVRLRGHADRLDADLLAAVGTRLVRLKTDEAERLLRAARARGPGRDARAVATFDLARLLKYRGEKRAREAEKLLEEVIARYADVDGHRGGLGKAARAELFDLRNLTVGKVAPEIDGLDGDGRRFKLSDYRGKVVVLDFWGHWCAPCRAAYPHLRALVKKTEGRPFALLGVNSDPKERVQAAVRAGAVTWRFWLDGGGRGGPIAGRWNVHSWPAVFVLDHRGVIRFRDVRGEELGRAVDELLRELEHEKKGPRKG